MLRWIKLPGGDQRAALEDWLDALTQGKAPED